MTYGRKNLKLSFRSGYAVPQYLSIDEHEDLIRSVIEFYEGNVGKPYGSIDWDELRIIVSDDRLYEALRKVMNYFYRPEAQGLRYVANPVKLRLRVFEIVNKRYGGFIPSDIRDEALRSIRDELGLKVNLDDVLWVDDPNEQPLVRVRRATITDVAKVFNYETLDTVCVNSSRIVIDVWRGEEGLGRLARIIGRYSKVYGLIYDMRYLGNSLRITIEGPHTLFGKPTRYGTRLSQLLMKVLPILKGMSDWGVTAYMRTRRGRDVRILLISNSLTPEVGIEGVKIREVFDSSIEEYIYKLLKSTGLRVVREEEPIALGDLLYLPDLKVYSNSGTYYVEIAGYWRREYAERKAYKLHEVSKVVKNLIVIADEKLRSYFSNLKVPVIYYKVLYGKPVLSLSKLKRVVEGKGANS